MPLLLVYVHKMRNGKQTKISYGLKMKQAFT